MQQSSAASSLPVAPSTTGSCPGGFLLAVVLLAWLVHPAVAAAPANRPNVLLVCVDDLKPLLGCYGDAQVRSPHIDRLAARGVRFDRAFCNQAVCSPSRNALMTGLRSTTLGIYDLATNFRLAAPQAITLAQAFQRQGWRTEALGKIFHVGHGNIDDAASWSVPHWNPRGGGYKLKESTSQPRSSATAVARGTATECADVPDNAYGDGMIADEAIQRLRKAKATPAEPFFLAVGFLKPHLPFVAPKRYWELYEGVPFDLPARQKPPEGAPAFASTASGELRSYSDIPETGPLAPDQQRHLIRGYHAAVSYMDAQLGRVLDELDRLGLAENTIIVLWGDHGWHLGDHGMWCKHTNYEQAARIPLIVRAPRIGPAGSRSGALVETVDLYPTLCDLAGIAPPPGLDGASFVAALKDPARGKTKETVFHAYPRSSRGQGELIGRAVRTERYRLVEWKRPGGPADNAVFELYDYETDPGESRNLAPEKPEVLASLRAILARQPEAKPQLKSAAVANAARAGASTSRSRPDRTAMFARRDLDKDGRLTRAEFLANQPDPDEAPKRFVGFDTNRDGFLSREEFVTMGGKASPQ